MMFFSRKLYLWSLILCGAFLVCGLLNVLPYFAAAGILRQGDPPLPPGAHLHGPPPTYDHNRDAGGLFTLIGSAGVVGVVLLAGFAFYWIRRYYRDTF